MPRKVPRPNTKKVKSEENGRTGSETRTVASTSRLCSSPGQKDPQAKQTQTGEEGPAPSAVVVGRAQGGASAPNWPALASLATSPSPPETKLPRTPSRCSGVLAAGPNWPASPDSRLRRDLRTLARVTVPSCHCRHPQNAFFLFFFPLTDW